MHLVRFGRDFENKSDRLVVLLALGVAAAALAIALNFAFFPAHETAVPRAPEVLPPSRTAIAAGAAAALSFDLIRISATGDAVIAGRAPAGCTVEILVDDAPIGRIAADGRGEWVFVPEQPLAPGSHRLAVRTLGDEGAPRGAAAFAAVTIPRPQ